MSTPSSDSDGYIAETSPKEGHVIFFLCDSRRAVVFLNSFAIIFYFICISFYGWQSAADYEGEFDGVDSITDTHWIVTTLLIIGLLCAGCGMLGARLFNSSFALIAAGWYIGSFILNFFTMNIPNAILMFVLAYPHVVFYNEVVDGTMTKEKYQNEIYSVCCV